MRSLSALSIICILLSTIRIADGNSNRRILQLEDVTNVILNTDIGEIFASEMKAIMVSRENPSIFRTPCTSPSAKWLQELTTSVSDDDLANFFDWYLHVIPFAYKLFIEGNDYDDEYFGLHGEYTDEVKSIHRRAEDFWSDLGGQDIGDIPLFCAHGSALADRDKLIPTLELLFGGSYDAQYTVEDHANDIQELILRLPGQYDYPLMTFNAFATDEVDENGPSIIIGDGYFQVSSFLALLVSFFICIDAHVG